jgi:hypothetical protein
LKDGGGEWLNGYLKTCWNLLVRSDVLVWEIGFGIDWQQVVTASIAGQFPGWGRRGREEKYFRWLMRKMYNRIEMR